MCQYQTNLNEGIADHSHMSDIYSHLAFKISTWYLNAQKRYLSTLMPGLNRFSQSQSWDRKRRRKGRITGAQALPGYYLDTPLLQSETGESECNTAPAPLLSCQPHFFHSLQYLQVDCALSPTYLSQCTCHHIPLHTGLGCQHLITQQTVTL